MINFGHLFVLNFPLVHNCRFVSLGQHLLSILWSINYSDRKGKWWQRTKLSPHLTKRPNFKINVLCFRETKLIPVVWWGSALSPEIKFWGLLNLMFSSHKHITNVKSLLVAVNHHRKLLKKNWQNMPKWFTPSQSSGERTSIIVESVLSRWIKRITSCEVTYSCME